jgi:methionyl-tRNA formyltransferase
VHLLEFDCKPHALLVADGARADYAEEMRRLVPDVPVLRGKEFRLPSGIDLLRSLDLDYFLSVHFPYIITQEVLDIPRIGTLNLHPAYLPYNRGWHTPSWAILEGTPYGATLHWVDEGIDTGDIALQRRIHVLPDDTAHTLYQRVLVLEEQLLCEALPLLAARSVPRITQEPGGTAHIKQDLQSMQSLDPTTRIEVGEFLKLLRALTTSDWNEAAYFDVDGFRFRVRVELARQDVERNAA